MSVAVRGRLAGRFAMQSEVGAVDIYLLIISTTLALLGLVIIHSVTLDYSAKHFGDPLKVFMRHFWHLCLAVCAAFIAFAAPLRVWQRAAPILLLLSVVGLALTLVDYFGVSAKGSQRWLQLGNLRFQTSEFAKLGLIVAIAAYTAERRGQMLFKTWAFLVPLGWVGLMAVLLVLQTDLGATLCLVALAMTMLFFSGVPLAPFAITSALSVVLAIGLTLWLRPDRLLAYFFDADPYGAGYQSVFSKIAIGANGFFGSGLGKGVTKQAYLPEAHTDFIFSVWTEEFGLFGALALIALFALLIWRLWFFTRQLHAAGNLFPSYLCFGLLVLICIELFVHIGVCTGLLPTTGLPLPLISYGGSSLLIHGMLLGLAMRASRGMGSSLSGLR